MKPSEAILLHRNETSVERRNGTIRGWSTDTNRMKKRDRVMLDHLAGVLEYYRPLRTINPVERMDGRRY